MANARPEAIPRILSLYQDSVNAYFKEVATEMWEKKRNEIIEDLDRKKTEIIVQMVRDISAKYTMSMMGDQVQIIINETKI